MGAEPQLRGVGGNPCKLDEEQIAQLRAALEAGPAAYGWSQDQRWTLARVAALVMRLFGVSYTLLPAGPALHGQPADIGIPHDTGLDPAPPPVTQARRP